MRWTPGRIKSKLRYHAVDLAWKIMIKSIRYWVDHHMDQFELVKFKSDYGYVTYVTISYYSEYPDAFEDLDNQRRMVDNTIDNR